MDATKTARGQLNYPWAPIAMAAIILAAEPAATVAQAPPVLRLPTCPASSDTLSLLQPSDSAFARAHEVAAELDGAGLGVRCITRSVWTGLAGVGSVAGLQTTQGTVTVFFVPPAEHFRLRQRRRGSGYELTYAKDGLHAARTTVQTDSHRPMFLLARPGQYYQVADDSLAAIVRRLLALR